jgi:hypothetical protein
MLVASLGSATAFDLGLSRAFASEADERLTFGDLEPLVSLMQQTPADKLLPILVDKSRNGTSLQTLTAAGALANARAFAGQDYTGYHTFMALLPALQMAWQLPEERRLLPVLKVLHRNSRRIQDQNADDHDALHPIAATEGAKNGEDLRSAVRAVDWAGAESSFAGMAQRSPIEAFDALQYAVQDDVNVHRVVLSWRAWAMLDVAGEQYAGSLLRQSLRFCLDSEQQMRDRKYSPSPLRDLMPKLMEDYKLLGKTPGDRKPDDAWVERLSATIYSGSRAEAAEAVAAALAEGFDPEAVGEALSLAANRLVLHDPGRAKENSNAEKPPGCVHGDSVGVHASDAANAWRSIARVSSARNRVASLIAGAFHTAGQAGRSMSQPHYLETADSVATDDGATLIADAEEAIRANEQARACAIMHRYSELGLPDRPAFDLLLKYAVSEDGALHAEKYYRTVSEEYASARPAFRSRHLIALARVTASEHGHPAPGYAEAQELLGIS